MAKFNCYGHIWHAALHVGKPKTSGPIQLIHANAIVVVFVIVFVAAAAEILLSQLQLQLHLLLLLFFASNCAGKHMDFFAPFDENCSVVDGTNRRIHVAEESAQTAGVVGNRLVGNLQMILGNY
jgi:hypothetical protein